MAGNFYKTVALLSDWHPHCDTAVLVIYTDLNLQLCITRKSMLTFPLSPREHAKLVVWGLLTTLWTRWITVDVQNECIYSHMRTAIITSVCLEDKAGFMWLCLRQNSWNLMRDERKPYFLIQFQLESTAAEILLWQRESKKSPSGVLCSHC